MSKWGLLKSSLVEKKRVCDSTSSIHRFTGFNFMSKKKIPWRGFVIEFTSPHILTTHDVLLHCNKFMAITDCTECIAIIHFASGSEMETALVQSLLSQPNVRLNILSENLVELYIGRFGDYTITLPVCDFWRNELCCQWNDGFAKKLIIFTREKPKDAGLSVKSLLSNKLHGVDNTGNICVWPAEPLLLHTLLNVQQFTEMIQGKRVLEIGGGMTALAGLGLAVAGLCADVTVTDGHPDCVKNQEVCIAMCKQEQERAATDSHTSHSGTIAGSANNHSLKIGSELLHWSPAVNAEQVSSLTRNHSLLFDVVLASDCLFFKDFHADLLHTLQQLLVPGGVGLFLQPCRDGTLQRFMALCAGSGAFSIELVEDYSLEVSTLRSEYLEKKELMGYVEDIHYPLMLIIKRI